MLGLLINSPSQDNTYILYIYIIYIYDDYVYDYDDVNYDVDDDDDVDYGR